MKLTVLLDNNTYIDEYYLGEPGVSYYIEDGDAKILFDTGYSAVFAENARRLGIDLNAVNTVVLSHGHDDHAGGLAALLRGDLSGDLKGNLKGDEDRRSRVSLVAHPRALDRKFYEGKEIGCALPRTEIAARCRLVQSQTPLKLTNRLTFLGEIPRTTEFEKASAIGEIETGGERLPDFLEDDTALVYRGEEGIYIITGCSHSGICNIVEYARKVTGVDRVCGIIGGFHLMEDQSERTRGTLAYLQPLQIQELYPCHCTSFAVRAAIHRESRVKEVGVGLELEWN